jgi:ribonuclease T1
LRFSPRFGNIYGFIVQGFPVVFLGRLQPWRPLLRWGAGIGVAGLLSIGAVQARDQAPTTSPVPLDRLPVEAQVVYRQIHLGGPFTFSKDGGVFGNRERLLPAEPRGYYREYTVAKPGSRDRGARRIVCGGEAARPRTCFYTFDHYISFKRITP